MRRTLQFMAGYLFGGSVFLVLAPAGLVYVAHQTDMADFPGIIPVRVVRTSLSIFLLVIGLLFMITSNVYLLMVGEGGPAEGLGIEISPRTQHLVETGPYRYTRNPMAFGALAMYTALALYLDSLAALLCIVALIPFSMLYLKRSEEKRLARDFGSEYADYRRRVSMLVPWFPQSDRRVSG